MFNKTQRTELAEFSLKIWGTSSQWQKRLNRKDPNFQVPVNSIQKKNSGMVAVKLGKGESRTRMSLYLAKAKGLVDKDFKLPETSDSPVFRDPTFDELKWMLTRAWDEMVIAHMFKKPMNPALPVFAYRLINNELKYPLLLQKKVKSDDYDKMCEDYLTTLPEDISKSLREIIQPADEPVKNPEQYFDAEEFLDMCVSFTVGDQAEHKRDVDELFQDSEESLLDEQKNSQFRAG